MKITIESNPNDILLGIGYMNGEDEDSNGYHIISLGFILFIINFIWEQE